MPLKNGSFSGFTASLRCLAQEHRGRVWCIKIAKDDTQAALGNGQSWLKMGYLRVSKAMGGSPSSLDGFCEGENPIDR